MSELKEQYEDYFAYTYTNGEQSYTVEYLPYDVLQSLFAEDIDMIDWDARKVVELVHKAILRRCEFTDKGFVIKSETDFISVYKSRRRIRTLYYFLVTGTYPSKRWQLVLPEDNRNTMEIERLKLRDKRADTKKATAEYLERIRRGCK